MDAVTSFSGHTLTVTDDVDYIQLKYTEVLNFTGTEFTTTEVENDLDIPQVTTVTAKVTNIEYRNELTKTCLNGDKESSESEDPINKTLNWQADITYDGKFADKEYIDVTTATPTTGDASHVVDLNSIVVRAAAGNVQGWEQPLTKDTDYTIVETNDGFKVVFSNNFDSTNQYNHVRITYSTTGNGNR